jgi:hypothetical protein
MMANHIQMDYLMQNGQMVKCKTRRRYAYKKTKETTNGFTKSYNEENEKN